MGVIRSQNTNPRTCIAGQVANFLVHYTMDNTTGTHALIPTTYNHFFDAWAPTNSWVLLRPLHEPDLTPAHPANDTAPWYPLLDYSMG
jgi:hypothetical protein